MFGLCTCCESCTIYFDDFNRQPKDQLDLPWMNEGKDFSIFSTCAIPDLPESEAILKIPHPKQNPYMVVELKTVEEPINQGVVYRLILNAVVEKPNPPNTLDLCDNYHFAEFVRNGINDSIIRLGVRSFGHETILKEDVIIGLTGDTRIFQALIGEHEFCASISNAVLSFVGMVINPGFRFDEGRYSGMNVRLKDDRTDLRAVVIGAPETPVVKIDHFKFSDHFDNNKKCASCLCKCDKSHEMPETLFVRIWPDPDDCPRLDLLKPCEFEIHWNRVDATWYGEGMCCQNQYYTPSGQRFKVQFNCPLTNYYGERDPFLASAALLDGCLNSCGKPPGECGNLDGPVLAKCYPMEFTFGPVFVSATDLLCWCTTKNKIGDIFTRGGCNYYVTIYWNP